MDELYKAIRVLFLEKPERATSFNHTCILESAHAISVSTVSLPVCRKTAQVMLDTLLELQKRHARQPAKRDFHSFITTLGGELWKMAKFQRTNEMLGALRKIMLGPWRIFPYNCCVAWVDVLCEMGIEPNPNDPAINVKPFPTNAEAEKMWRKRHGTTPAPAHGPFPGEPDYVVPPAREWLPAMRCEHGTNCGGGLRPKKGEDTFEDFLAFMESGAYAAARQVSYDKPADQLMGCQGCQAVFYCSSKCQRACWTAYGPALLRGDPVPPQGPLGRLHKDNLGNKPGDIHKLGCKLLQQIKGEEQANT